MNINDWALITFTILVQMSVGSMWVLGVMHFVANRQFGMEDADRLSDRSLVALVPVIGFGFLASLFHLGNPVNAYRAITNLGTSWLSREILFGVIFALLATAFAFMQWRKIGSFAARNIVAWLAALAGLMLVYSMASVYMLPSQPAWNSWATPVSFFATTLLLGALAMGVAFVTNYAYLQRKQTAGMEKQTTLLREALRWIAVASIVLLGVELVVFPVYLATVASGSVEGLASVQLMAGVSGWMMALRLVLAFIGAGIFAMFLYQNAMVAGHEMMLGNLAYTAFFIVFIAEVMGRAMFYLAHVRVGI